MIRYILECSAQGFQSVVYARRLKEQGHKGCSFSFDPHDAWGTLSREVAEGRAATVRAMLKSRNGRWEVRVRSVTLSSGGV